MAFQDFLKSEYSEENILFWLACEEYKKIKSEPEMISMANQIYTEFVQTEAPRQVNYSPLTELCWALVMSYWRNLLVGPAAQKLVRKSFAASITFILWGCKNSAFKREHSDISLVLKG